MPVHPLKNAIYQAGMAALRPLNNHQLTIEGADLPGLEQILRRRQIHRAALLFTGTDGAKHKVRTGCPDVPPEKAYFHGASIAKMVTAIGALKLVQQGQLPLGEPVNKYSALPLPPGVTLEHLLSHTSGIVDGPGYGSAIARHIGLDELIHQEGFLSPHKPGEHFQYSNFAFGLVGSLMEEATGLSLHQLMTQQLFEPCGMDAVYDLSTLGNDAFIVSSKRLFPPSKRYALDGPGRLAKAASIKSMDPLHHYGLAAGGLFITAEGLFKLVKLLAEESSILTSEIRQSMLSPRYTHQFPGYRCGFGLGIFCLESADGAHRIYGHQGFAYGAVQGAFWNPDTHQVLVSMNGGADESRQGHMGLTNLDLINLILGGCAWTL